VTAYYARLTQALVTALSAQMAEGQLYAVDMRLRPSGRQGPVATSWAAFRSYHKGEAWTWEHMALTRARAVAGAPDLCAGIEAFRAGLLARRAEPGRVAADAAAMRERIAAAAAPARLANPWEAKLGPGRMQDIELLAQAGALIAGTQARGTERQLAAAVAAGWLDTATAARLTAAHRLWRRLNQCARLLMDKPLDLEAAGEGGRAFLLRETGQESVEALAAELAEAAETSAAAVAARLGVAAAEAAQ
jgi:glutamate-ammonia-ligase adenylyltransferase